MSMPPKPEPILACSGCGELLHRKRINGRLEDLGIFTKRKYCNRMCMAKGQTRETVRRLSNSRIKAHRKIKSECETCGAAGRLHVHHRDENPFNNSIANLQTLCPSCHLRMHSPNYLGIRLQRIPCLHCSKPVARKGLCNTHLTRFKKYGDPFLKKLK